MANVEELVRRSKAKDRKAFAELISLYQDRVYRLGYHLTGNQADAEDLVQEVFLRAYLNIGGFRQEADFGTWLHRITVNLWVNIRRKHKNHLMLSLDAPVITEEGEITREVAATDPDPLEIATDREFQQLVQKAVKQLSPEFRAVLVLREIEGYNYEEIARFLGCSLGTVKSRLNRARQALKTRISQMATQGGYSLPDR